MNSEQKLCYFNTLHRILNISVVYKGKDVLYNSQSFIMENATIEPDLMYQRLSGTFLNFSVAPALLFVHKTLLMSGMIVNRTTGEYAFIGPVPSPLATEKDFRDYFFMSDLGEDATHLMTNYLKASRTFTIEDFQELLININLIINGEILKSNEIESIYDRQQQTREKLARQLYNKEDDNPDNETQLVVEDFNKKLQYCVTNGDAESLKNLLYQMSSIPYKEGNITSPSEIRTEVIGAIFVGHEVAARAGVALDELERTKQYYLMQVNAAPTAESIKNISTSALIEFTEIVAANKKTTSSNPTIERAIVYINANITSKLLAADIAKALNISENYLFSKFKAETGKTLTQYINEEKVKKSMYYLTFTDKTLSQISYHLSFSSQSYFQTVFKKITGMTPAQYRISNTKERTSSN